MNYLPTEEDLWSDTDETIFGVEDDSDKVKETMDDMLNIIDIQELLGEVVDEVIVKCKTETTKFNMSPESDQNISSNKKESINVDSDVDYSSSDNVPLSRLVLKDLSDIDMVDSEDSYKPKVNDMTSTDSEFDEFKSMQKRKKKKKKVKHIPENRTPVTEICSNIPSSAHNDVAIAEQRSLQDHKRKQTVMKIHERRLDRLLFSNGLEREKVNAHGNCFFEATSFGIDSVAHALQLRQILCDHIENYADEYICFMNNSQDDNSLDMFMEELNKLRQDCYWTNKVADVLPLALANWSSHAVTIYTSNVQKPVIEIQPTITETSSSKIDPITLAYITPNGLPSHYDACIRVSHKEVRVENDDETEKDPNENVRNSEKSPRRLSAKFMTPPKNKKSRKRKAMPESWKKNIRKKLKLSGKEYVNQQGTTIKARSSKKIDCSKCKFKCSNAIPDEKREEIFKVFWNLENVQRQKDFICSHVNEKATKTYLDADNKRMDKKRQVSRSYQFSTAEENIQVCKKFFLTALDIGESYVNNAVSNKNGCVYTGIDKRGKHTAHNKTKDLLLQKVKEHIISFPRVEGHYTRKDSNREYLGAELNITKMYELYKEQYCEEDIVSQQVYRKMFNEEFNLSFHIPKKRPMFLVFPI